MATGLIWTRWCFVIRPQNMFLASVNFLLFCVGATQVGRILSFQSSQKGQTITQEVGSAAKEQVGKLEEAVDSAKAKLTK